MPEPQPVAVLTPLVTSEPIELAARSRTFWKDVLRAGTIDYKGRKLDFTTDYMDGLALAHEQGAFDYVPMVFAPADNAHTQAVDHIRGDILGFKRQGDRLRALVRASTDEAAELLRNNPNIGCSVRIEQPLERSDGKRWPAAIQHVLVTANPRINGLGPWEPVELAADGLPVIDLSIYDFADGEDTATEKESQMALTEEDVARIVRSVLAEGAEGATTGPAPTEPAEGEYVMPSDEELAEIAQSLFDADEIAAFEAESNPPAQEPAPTETETEQLAAAGLSREQAEALELANSRIDEQAIELARWRERAQQADYEAERDRLVRDHGIPPHVVEMARPLLLGSHTVELSNGSEVDAGEVVRKVLTALAEHTALVDLSRGTTWDAAADTQDEATTAARAAEAAEYVKAFGL